MKRRIKKWDFKKKLSEIQLNDEYIMNSFTFIKKLVLGIDAQFVKIMD